MLQLRKRLRKRLRIQQKGLHCMKGPNISDVAKLAGVSTATVSHVINDTRFVTEETQKKVRDAIEQLGYIPSSVARGLASNRTRTVGVIFSDIGNPFFVSVYRGIQSCLENAGYRMRIFSTDEIPKKQETMLRECIAARLDGLIIAPTGYESELLNALPDMYGIPVVLIDRRSPGADFPLVAPDNKKMAYDAVHHLIQDGHRRIGVILGHKLVSTTKDRLSGYKQALLGHGLSIRDEYVYQGTSRLSDNGYSGMMELCSLSERPTAVFATNNLMTLGALHALRKLGLGCPNDMGLLGIDDHDWADIFSPPLSVIRQPASEMGHAAACVLEDLIDGKKQESGWEALSLHGEAVIRGSCSEKCWQAFAQTLRDSPFEAKHYRAESSR